MKKTIIAAALVLVSAVTAYSLTGKAKSPEPATIKIENTDFKIPTSASPKSDLATAD